MVYATRRSQQHAPASFDKKIEHAALPTYLSCSASVEMLPNRPEELQKKLMKHLPVPMLVIQGGRVQFQNNASMMLFSNILTQRTNGEVFEDHCPTSSLTSLFECAKEGAESLQSHIIHAERRLHTHRSDDIYVQLLENAENCGLHRFNGQEYSVMSQYLEWNEELALLLVLDSRLRDPFVTLTHSEEDMLKTVCHDLRNPLTSLSMTMDMLQKSIKDCQLEEQMRAAKASTEMVLSLSEDLLDYLQLQSGSLRLSENYFNPVSVANSVRDVLAFKSGSKKIKLEIEATDLDSLEVRNDVNRTRQILVNLVSNAIKFSPENASVVINVKKVECNSKPAVRFSVRDNGIGISLEEQRGLFNKQFFKSDSKESIACNPRGVGLGLAISHRISKVIGYGIQVDSTPGVGSTFSFDIDATDSRMFHTKQVLKRMTSYSSEFFDEMSQSERSPSAEMPQREFKVNSTSPGNGSKEMQTRRSGKVKTDCTRSSGLDLSSHEERRGVRANLLGSHLEEDQKAGPADILVIDDTEFCQFSLRTMFKLFHTNIETAWNGQEGLQKVKVRSKLGMKPYKAIFIDQNMPGMTGEQCAEAIREISHAENTLLIGFSGDNDDWAQPQLFDDFLSKPFERNGFARLISQFDLAA
eukprot:CAMPEP_0114988476 /NCGR_PEP_ID=MMETSP0216-20121206/9621_1 /TAXON_ID=223996 /ORGANISM="Protocruzia adherens, Strain Boccale" /LENGTH=639 /DNA_ID=CAMNT_0002351263 /DNA_START=317 /DNA_END=2236 /DNA_ORIENTATION=-